MAERGKWITDLLLLTPWWVGRNGEPPPFDLRLARATGRRTGKLFAEYKRWRQHSPWLEYAQTMAEYLASADGMGEAMQFARLLEQATQEVLGAFCHHRIDLMCDLRVIAEQASRIASGRNPIIDRTYRPGIPRVPDHAAIVRLTHVYIPVDTVRTRELVRRWVAAGNDPGRAARCLLGVAIGVLPVPARPRYAEEYGAELWALRDGPAWRRVGYAIRQASRAWSLRRDLQEAGPALWSEWYRGQ